MFEVYIEIQQNISPTVYSISSSRKYQQLSQNNIMDPPRPVPQFWGAPGVIETPVFGKEWTEAYFNILKNRLSDDLFRGSAGEVIVPLATVFIDTSLQLFNREKIQIEAERHWKEIKQLEDCRGVIVQGIHQHLDPDFDIPESPVSKFGDLMKKD